ncbi:TPA: hypothetical protein ACV4T7_004010 [Burkholderia ambifaria]
MTRPHSIPSRPVIHIFSGAGDRRSGIPDTQKTPQKQGHFSFVTQQTSSVTLRAPCHTAAAKRVARGLFPRSPKRLPRRLAARGPGVLRAIATLMIA